MEARANEKELINQKIARLELSALQSQMNPHFIFNALNSIQAYVLNNETQKAEKYIQLFSKLIRKFLDFSRKKFISIDEEINILELYTSIEMMRFNNRFITEIHCDKKISKDLEIPSLLIQPFVENAIKHGLSKKKEGGLLKISFDNYDDTITCTIFDNGIGRKNASTQNQQSNSKKHQSLGTELIKERINTLNTLYKTPIELEIIDLLNPSGTKVIIKIPKQV